MKCTPIRMPNGNVGIICGPRRIKVCIVCRAFATRECDWNMRKLPSGRQTTCDAGLCDEHTFSPAPGKDLCPRHREAWSKHPMSAQRALPLKPDSDVRSEEEQHGVRPRKVR